MTLLELAETYDLQLEQRGLEFWGSSPFTEDRDPSFSIDSEHDIFYCFSTKIGGGKISFIQNMENIPWMEAKRKLDKLEGREVEIDEGRELLTNIVESLKITKPEYDNMPYFKDRGISYEAVSAFDVGFCDSYKDLLSRFGVSETDAESLGLYDISRCIVYPFFDIDGVFKIHSRSIDEKAYKTKKGLYWRNSLWGLNKVHGGYVYMVEGFHDVLVAWDHGYDAVAMNGTTIHDEYWKELRDRKISEVYMVPDGDRAGRDLLKKLLKTRPSDILLQVIELPSDTDPDDAILDGTFDQLRPKTLVQWYAERGNIQSLADQARFYRDLQQYFSKLPEYERVLTKEYLVRRFGVEAMDHLYDTVEPDYVAEKVVLANSLVSGDSRFEMLRLLDADCFHTQLHRNMFETIRENDNATIVLIQQSYEIDLSGSVDILNYQKYIDSVRLIYLKERIDKVVSNARSRLSSNNPEEIVGGLVNRLYTVVDDDTSVFSGDEVTKNVMRSISDKVKNPDVTGISLNMEQFPTMNRALLGLVPSKFILVSGNTGHGKTTLVVNWTTDLIDRGVPTLFVTLEMSPDEIIEKHLAIKTGIAGTKIATGSLEQSEYDELVKQAKGVIGKHLRIAYRINDLHKLVSVIKAQILRFGIRVVVIDYLQLVTLNNRDDRWLQLMEVSKTIKNRICMAHDVTVIGISQLNKGNLTSAVPEASNQAGSYGMLADVDVGIAIKRLTGKEIKNGVNMLVHIDKHRYNYDNIMIDCSFDKGLQKIREV